MGGAPFDLVDVRILRQLVQGSTLLAGRPGLPASYRELSRRVGTNRGTVRNRLARMYRSNVLSGSTNFPNPRLVGLRVAAYAFDVGSRRPKEETVRRLLQLDGVLFLHNHHGPGIGIVVVYEAGTDPAEPIARVDRVAEAVLWRVAEIDYPIPPEALSASDRAFVGRLTRGGFRSYRELADDTGLSVRTVKRKFARLVAGHAVFSIPTLNYPAIRGAVPADIQVAYTSPAARAQFEPEVVRLLEDRCVFIGQWTTFSLYSMVLPNVGRLTDLTDRLRALSGVDSVRSLFVEEHFDQSWVLGRYLGPAAPDTSAARSPVRGTA
jgi:DNA-binding Lrp family transcriptional regulator